MMDAHQASELHENKWMITTAHQTAKFSTRYPPPIPGISTDLPTCTVNVIRVRKELSPLVPALCSAYPQAYAQTCPHFGNKHMAGGETLAGNVKRVGTGAGQAIE
jgi:hypothetical protein